MAANKFATMLHRNTHKMGVILVYTLLEWILIALLLLNALFSYLVARFATFFGLKPPCLFCSRVDHLFEPGKGQKSYRNLLCDAHAAEVSELGYCSSHRKLAEASDMCEDCSSSRPSSSGADRTVALFSWMKKSEEGEKDLRCSCCDVILESGFYSPYLLVKPSWGVLDYTQKGNLAEEKEEDCIGQFEDEILSGEEEGVEKDVGNTKYEILSGGEEKDVGHIKDDILSGGEDGEERDHVLCFDHGGTGLEREEEKDEEHVEGDGETGAPLSVQELESSNCLWDDASLEILPLHLDNFSDEQRLVPVELIDSTTLMKSLNSSDPRGENDGELGSRGVEQAVTIRDIGSVLEEKPALVSTAQIGDKISSPMLEMVDADEEYDLVPPADEANRDCSSDHHCVVSQATQTTPQGGDDVEVEMMAAEDFGEFQAFEEDNKALDAEANCEISIGSEICEQEQIDRSHFHEQISSSVGVEGQVSESYVDTTDKDQVTESESMESARRDRDHHLSISPELNEVEEERAPETPTYIEGIHTLHKRFQFERRETGTESLDGSVVSEVESGEPLTVDHLKSALKTERKALSALYGELEEERSASAIAANQTMAMITRLQEEKAAMQMEALQYQRMMEEQSEYDQEALQLLNELMIKREKEKQDIEKELEVYRKKVLLYEAKERRKVKRNKANCRSGTSSASSSAEDSDDLSFEYNEGDEGFYSLSGSNQNTPIDAALSYITDYETTKHLSTLDESLADFEEERLSILEQLKALEEKLFILDDEESPDNIKAIEHFSEENGHVINVNLESSGDDVNDVVNGFSDEFDANGKLHCGRRNIGCRGKRLLPLFDATTMENENGICTEQEGTGVSPESVSKFTTEHRKLAIVEEVDNVYERLQALEADREFLKHCISSLKKGDKGMGLLQEILQHLRDLRTVELRVRDAGDVLASLSA